MENQDTMRLLRECDAGAKMGVASIDGVLENVKNQELHDLLAQSRKRHEQLGNRTMELLSALGDAGKEPPAMAKGMAAMKSGMKMMMGNPDQQAADLITDGCGMGVKKNKACATGTYGPSTVEAVRAFQQATDKVPTGIANHHTQLTLQHIYEETYWQDDANFIVRDE